MSDSYIVRLERLRVQLRDILRNKGFSLNDDVTLQTLISKVEGIGNYNIVNALFTNEEFVLNDAKNEVRLIKYNSGFRASKVSKLILPVTTKIEGYAFRDCTALTEVRGDSCTWIGEQSFYQCSNLEKAIFPKLVQFNYGRCFQSCSKLKSFILPKTFTGNFEMDVFTSCTALSVIIIEPVGRKVGLTGVGGTPFTNGSGGIFYVPYAMKSTYVADSAYSSLASASIESIEENLSTLHLGDYDFDISDYYEIVTELPASDINDAIVYLIETATPGVYAQHFHGSGSWVELQDTIAL